MADQVNSQIELIGFGTGAGTKTRILLEHLHNPAVYMPVDISKEQLTESTALFRELFPTLEILPVCADYLQPLRLPTPTRETSRKVVYFPGSTIGNFEPPEALKFLQRLADFAEPAAAFSSEWICKRTARFWSAPTTTARA